MLYLDKNRCGMRADWIYASCKHFNRNRWMRILLSHRNWIEKAHHLHPQMILPCQNLLQLDISLWHALVHTLTHSSANYMRTHGWKHGIFSSHIRVDRRNTCQILHFRHAFGPSRTIFCEAWTQIDYPTAWSITTRGIANRGQCRGRNQIHTNARKQPNPLW